MNSIATSKGGTHVNAITDQVCEKVMAIVQVQRNQPRSLLLSACVRANGYQELRTIALMIADL